MLGTQYKEADKDPIFSSPDQTWRKHDAQFHQTSTKYHKKPDYQPTYVGVPWSIVDPTNLVGKERSPNSKGLDQVGGWKKYSQYDV